MREDGYSRLFCNNSPHYFKSCRISAIALIKMVLSCFLARQLNGAQMPHLGHSCPLRCSIRNHGSYAREGRRQQSGCHGLVCASRARNGNAREYVRVSERIHGGIHHGRREGDDFTLVCEAQLMLLKVGELGNILGWYHSHPGYGCWLSGIDVSTQSTHQKFQDPFVAVVVRYFVSLRGFVRCR